ncbi:MAG: helix-turn-helix transcriptional regulator [Ruminococcus sp.]|nr:helix-turn-helix transcriptional regulator [Ruminococcus sp.]
MRINNVGYNHCHDADFFIDRPDGSGDYLLLLLKTASVFTLEGKDVHVPAESFFLYQKGTPQFYRCVPQHIFSNDWIHFQLEEDEETQLLKSGIPLDTPIPVNNLNFLSFCVKSIAYEAYSANINREKSITAYMGLLFLKIQEQLFQPRDMVPDSRYEMLSTIRNKIYTCPYEVRTVESTAHEVRMSKSSFQHLYKKQFGTTFMQDLIQSRVSHAKMLLTSTNLSVSEIAVQCGYHSYAHFVRQFRSWSGVTPTEYRNTQSREVTSKTNLHDM